MSGGKGGSQTQTTQQTIPEYLREPIKRNIARAEDISKIGFVPYMGPEVAALTPMQEAAMQSTGMAAQAYGMPNALGNQVTPEPQTFAGGVQGYSSFPLYEQAIAELQASRPGQYDAIMGQFIDPVTGELSSGSSQENQNKMTDRESIYQALNYQKVPSYRVQGVGDGVFQTESGEYYMSPSAYRSRFGK